MKHGPIALIDTEMPVVVVATHNNQYEKIISNIQEIKARKGKVIALVTEGDTTIKNIADFCIELPKTIQRERCRSAEESRKIGNRRIKMILKRDGRIKT